MMSSFTSFNTQFKWNFAIKLFSEFGAPNKYICIGAHNLFNEQLSLQWGINFIGP